MKISRKTLQIGLLLLGFALIILTYFVYPKTIIEKAEEKKEIELKEEVQEDTSFVNVEYKGLTQNGSPYTVKSEYANINKENEDLVHMTYITAKYYYEDGGTITITSDEGLFNKNTGDINFIKNVKMIDQENNILTSDNLDMMATEEYANAYNNVEVFTYDGQTIVADQIKVDAVEKTLKVSMFNNEEKIKMKLIE